MGFYPSLLILFAFIESMLGLFIYTYLYLQAMAWFQNYEYNKHKKPVLAHSILMCLSLSLLVFLCYSICFQSACRATSDRYLIS